VSTKSSRPGGNITGFTLIDFSSMIGKWLEMLKEIAPNVRRVTLMFDPETTPFYPAFLQELEAANKSLAVELSASPVHDDAEVEAAITALAREPGGGLIAPPDVFISNHRRAIMTLTERHRLPAIYALRQFVTEGALISYGPDTVDVVRRSAGYVDKVKDRPTFRCRRRPSSSWSSISKLRKRSAWTCRRCSNSAPTR
jgi:putative ABC transport system substrate-binding protein